MARVGTDALRTPGWFDAMRIAYAVGGEAVGGDAVGGDAAVEHLPLAQAAGRTLAAELRTTFDIPHYDSAAMDGFAVAGDPPWQLDGALSTDDTGPLLPGSARTIVTGGRVPKGTSGVVRVEYTVVSDDRTAVQMAADAPTSELAPGRHIRPAGREAAAGDLIAAAGRPLTPPVLAMAAICGYDEVPVRPAVTAAVLFTGDEVLTSGIPGPGQVRDAFSVQLPYVLRMAGVDVVEVRRIRDDRDATETALAELSDAAHFVVTTGGTGRSGADHIRAQLEDLSRANGAAPEASAGLANAGLANAGSTRAGLASARVVIEELAMRPGHPTMLAMVERAVGARPENVPAGTSRRVPVLALPGNPLAAMTAMRVLGSALVRGLRGEDPEVPLTVPAARNLPAEKVERLAPAAPAESAASAVPAESAAPGQEAQWLPCTHIGSNMIRGLTSAQGWIVLPTRPVVAGERIPFLPLGW